MVEATTKLVFLLNFLMLTNSNPIVNIGMTFLGFLMEQYNYMPSALIDKYNGTDKIF